jgi:mono/diheme cytochrome c family protein
VFATGGPAIGQTPANSVASSELLDGTLNRYCVACHNDGSRTAGLSLAGVSARDVAGQAATLEKVLHKLRSGEMPPAGRPAPETTTTANLVRWLTTELDRVASEQPNPGAPAIHRLNRAEYQNAVRDLLSLDLDHARDLPADDSGYGFDNIGDVLTVSPLHVEQYIAAARRISRQALGTDTARPMVERYTARRGQTDEAIDQLPPNERGGIVLHHYFPFDAEYSILVRIRGRRVPGMPPPKLDVRVDGRRVQVFDADFDGEEANQGTREFEVDLRLTAGDHEIAAGFLNEYARSERTESRGVNGSSVDYVLVDGPYDPTGPGTTASRQRILVCRPAPGEPEEPCARRIVTDLARQAYRRPVFDADIDPLLDLFALGRGDGASFEAGIEMALSGILVSPNFLFRAPSAPADGVPGSVYQLSDIDLASRLSFFLWSSIPDDELLRLAEQGQLSEPRTLAAQLVRMLADEKARALVENFGGQWLHLRNVADWTPDPERFPDFDDSLRYAFQRETELFLEHMIRSDGRVLDLIDADYTFLNERLADFYDVDDVEGGYFRRVSLAGTGRGGIMTHGSILMVTSYPTRTSPVLRGKWVLENILGAPPPPPPPDVPVLDERAEQSAGNLREALEQHRANPACAVCHSRLDPLGFALENFDAVGEFRSEDDGGPVEASGALPDGTLVDGPLGLRDVLLARQDEFVEALAERLLTYALGRGLESYDRPAVREIRRQTESGNYRFSALVEAIVDSVPFRLRRIPE